MPEHIFYRFYCNTEFSKLEFSAHSLPLWEVRSLLISALKMESNDFDLLFYEDDTIILDDYYPVHRNTYLVIKRVPLYIGKILRKGENVKPEAIIYIKENDESSSESDENTENQTTNHLPDKVFEETDSKKILRENDKKQKTYITTAEVKESSKVNQNCAICKSKNSSQPCTHTEKLLTKIRGVPKDFLSKAEKNDAHLVTTEGAVKIVPQVGIFSEQTVDFRLPECLKCRECGMVSTGYFFASCGHLFCDICGSKAICCGKRVAKSRYDEKMKKRICDYAARNN